LFNIFEHYIISTCMSPSEIGIDRFTPQIEQAIVDGDMVSLTISPFCSFVDCTTFNELLDAFLDILSAVLMALIDIAEIIDCNDIHSIYSAIVQDEMCENFLTGLGWMYLMLLLISFFGMIIITFRNVVWLSLAAKITPSISPEERSSLIRLPSVGTDGAVVNDTAVVTDAVVPCRVIAPLGSGRSEFNATRNSPDCSVKRESSRTLQRKGNYIIKFKSPEYN